MIARLHKKVFYAILIILPLAIVFTALFIGRYPLSIGKVLSILAMRSSDSITDIENAVVWDVRLPRAVTGAIIGAALAAAVRHFKGFLKIPLLIPAFSASVPGPDSVPFLPLSYLTV